MEKRDRRRGRAAGGEVWPAGAPGSVALHAGPGPPRARPEEQRGRVSACSLWTRALLCHSLTLTYFFLFLYASDRNSLKSALL